MTGEQLLRRPLAALRQHARERALDRRACWPTAAKAHFGPVAADLSDLPANSPLRPLARDLFALGAREADEIAARFPKVQRRVGGYNIDALVPGRNDVNLAHILVGSEGTLGVLDRDRTEAVAGARPARGRRLPLRLASTRRWRRRSTSSSSRRSRSSLSTRTMIGLARDIAMFRPTLEAFVRGEPAAVLLVEFAEDARTRTRAGCKRLARTDRRSRHELEPQRRLLGRRGRRARSETAGGDHRASHRRPQHHDVDEGGGEAGLLRRGLRGAAGASRRLHRAADRGVREERHHAAPGTRTPRSAACMCGRS